MIMKRKAAGSVAVVVKLLHFPYDLLKTPRHEVGSLLGAVVPLQVFQEAQEQSIDRHFVDAEEGRGDKVSPEHDHDDGRGQEVQVGDFILDVRNGSGEDEVGQTSDSRGDDQLAQKEQKVDDFVEDDDTDDVPHEEGKGFLCADAEVRPLDGADDVSVAINELHELLQTPQAALAHADQAAGEVVVVLLQLVLDVGQNGPQHFNDGDDQRSERHGSQMKDEGVEEGSGQRATRHLLLVPSPIPQGENTGQNHLAQSVRETHSPVESE